MRSFPILCLLTIVLLSAMYNAAWSQCTNPPNGPGCLCSTADVLCTPDDLDGFSFSMSSETNDGDLPDGFFNADLCPGINSQDGFPNNVNFFSFIAWCEDLTFDVLVSNCQDNPNDNQTSFGIQMALFADCGSQSNGWDPVVCFTEGDDYCFNTQAQVPAVQTFAMNGLTVGNTYYFMLDGCAQSTCDITIDVIGTCGTGEIDPWTTGLEGPQSVCAGIPFTYTAEDLDGAVEFYYYLDGNLIADGEELTSIDYTFSTPGTYELCVDVSNLPCIPESDDPPQNCITIEVIDLEAGEIDVNPNPMCPGETATVTVSGYNTDPSTSLVLYILDENREIQQVVFGDNTTVIHDECAMWTALSYNFFTADMPTIQTVGQTFVPIDCTTNCCDTEEEDIIWEDTEQPVLTGVPADESVDCADDVSPPPTVSFTDNCIGTGTVMPVIEENFTICDGGTITRRWQVVDSCDNQAVGNQTITIAPVPLATFDQEPGDITVDCASVPSSYPDLVLTNSAIGACEINETVSPTVDDQTDVCGGTIVVEWAYDDFCNRNYTVIQNITVDPPPAPTFQSMPASVNLVCGDGVPAAIDLTVSNGASGACEINEQVSPVISGMIDICGGTMTYTWTYMDNCGNNLNYTQTITADPPAPPTFDNPPADITVSCEDVPATAPDLNYDNGETGTCAIAGAIAPVIDDQSDICGGTITYDWEFTDQCNRTISERQVITIAPAEEGMFMSVPLDITIDCGDTAGDPVDLEISNGQSGNCQVMETIAPQINDQSDVCGGSITYTWEYTDQCNRTQTESQTVTINPVAAATWVDAPMNDLMVDCDDFDPNPPDLEYSNGLTTPCQIAGFAPGTVQGIVDACGGTVMYVWEYTDDCNRTITHTQNVIIAAASQPTFNNVPADVTLDCADVPVTPPDLTYSNGESGTCAISGTAAGIRTGVYDACGGNINFVWTATDACGNNLSASQNVEVLPAADPMFINTPPDITLDCGDPVPPAMDLDYSNGATGDCAIEGTVQATSSVIGQVTTYEWTFTTSCTPSVTINYTQDVTERPAPDIVLSPDFDIICLGESYDLTTLSATDANGETVSVSFSDVFGSPITNTTISPTENTQVVVTITNSFGCSDQTSFFLNVDQLVTAGTGTSGQICKSDGFVNLFDFITPPFSLGGTWFDVDFSGVNLTVPEAVNFTNVTPGTYQFDYFVPSNSDCPDSETSIFITVAPEVEFGVTSLECNATDGTYNIVVNTNGYTVIASNGTVTVIDDSTIEVTGIPINSFLLLQAFDPLTNCLTDLTLSPPDCDCPSVPEPTNNGNAVICIGDDNPELSVMVESGLTANWYDAQVGGNSVANNTLTFIPSETMVGVYTYWATAVDPDGCESVVRVPVTFEILALPILNPVTVGKCADENGEIQVVLSTEVANQVNTNTSFTYVYFQSQQEAEDENNPLTNDTLVVNFSTILYVLVTSTQGCQSIGEVQLNVFPTIELDVVPTAESCPGEQDGSLAIANVLPSGTQFDLDGSDYNDTLVYDNLTPGNYTINSQSPDGCLSTTTVTIDAAQSFSRQNLSSVCDFSNTDTDPADDFYTISFGLSVGAATDYTLTSSMGDIISSTVVDSFVFTWPADGTVQTFTLEDGNGCIQTFDVGPLNPCSTDCSFEVTTFEYECSSNNTATNPNDDTYTVDLLVTSQNGTSPLFEVLLENVSIGIFTYDNLNTFTIDAQSGSVTFTIVDSSDDQCFTTFTVDDLLPCSDDCIVDGLVLATCEDQGTIGVPEDDVYTIQLSALGINTLGTAWVAFVGSNEVASANYGDTIAISLPADGSTIEFTLEDSDDPSCNTTITIGPLLPCSGSCVIDLGLIETTCDNSGTGADEVDDTFTADLSVNLDGGSGNWSILGSGIAGNSTMTTAQVGPFLIADGPVTIIVQDTDIPSCGDTLVVQPPLPCSSCQGEVNAGVDQELTCDVTSIVLNGTSNPTPVATFWTNPSMVETPGNSVTANSLGQYIFTADFGDNCFISDTLEVTSDDSVPVADSGLDQVFTCFTDSLVFVGTASGGSGNFSYEWTDAQGNILSTNQILVVFSPGTFSLEVTDINSGCVAPISQVNAVDQTDGPSALITANPGNTLDCEIQTIILTHGDEENVVYTWLYGNQSFTGNNLEIRNAIDVTLMALDTLTGCDNIGMLTITDIEEYPIINIAAFADLDCDNSSVIIDASTSQQGPNIVYSWQDELGNELQNSGNTFEVMMAGTYILQLTDIDNGCENADTFLVADNGEYPELAFDDEVEIACDSESATLGITILDNTIAASTAWTATAGNIISGENTLTAIVDGPGIYEAVVTDVATGCETVALIEVAYPDAIADYQIDIQDESCEENMDGAVMISLIEGGTPPYSYFLNGIEVNGESIAQLAQGTYEIVITDANQCSVDTTIVVGTLPAFEVSVPGPIFIEEGETDQLTVTTNLDENEIASIQWSPANGLNCDTCATVILTGVENQLYTVTITDIFGCEIETSVLVNVTQTINIDLPNVIMGDGTRNNTFYPISDVEGTISKLSIFDRWGNLVFASAGGDLNDPSVGWDGTFKGDFVVQGVYVYYVEIVLENGDLWTKSGDLTVLFR